MTQRRIAIIDIGSNALRASVYSDNTIGACEIYHERFRVDINQLFAFEQQGHRNSFANIMSRFVDIFEKLDVSIGDVTCVATAILRDSGQNVEEFCNAVYSRFKIKVKILTGSEEAYLSSCGLLLGTADSAGVIVDLGGGSLEIAECKGNHIARMTSIPIGTKVLNKDAKSVDVQSVYQTIKAHYGVHSYDNLYLTGGGFRVIGRSYIEHEYYPLKNLHNVELSAEPFYEYLESINAPRNAQHTPKKKLDRSAVIVLQALIKLFNTKIITISNYGLKEGVRFEKLPQEEKGRDIIMTRCRAMSNSCHEESTLDAYCNIISNVKDIDREMLYVLRIVLVLVTAVDHIDRVFQGNFLANMVLMSDIPFKHKQRISLAFILTSCFGHKPSSHICKLARSMLDKSLFDQCVMLAAFVNMAIVLDGPKLVMVPSFEIVKNQDNLTLSSKQTIPYQIFDSINQNLKLINKTNVRI